MFNCIRLCLDVSFLQNTLQHVQVLGNTDFLLVCIENFPGTVQLQVTVVIALLDCITSTGGRCGIILQMSHVVSVVAWSVCIFCGCDRVPCKNGGTDQDVVLGDQTHVGQRTINY